MNRRFGIVKFTILYKTEGLKQILEIKLACYRQGVSVRRGSQDRDTPPYGNGRTVRILLECILVTKVLFFSFQNEAEKNRVGCFITNAGSSKIQNDVTMEE